MLNTKLATRFLLFLCGCITVRVLFVIIAKMINKDYLPILGIFGLVLGWGFIIIFAGNLRTTGPEVMGDKIWWNSLRPVHGLLYLIFALLAILKSDYTYIPLALDVVIGISAFMYYHITAGSFTRLLV